jgi:hypothetical protein
MVEQSDPPRSPTLPAQTEAAPRPDLSAEIAAYVRREPSDRVSCRHVHGDHYRCNWWSRADATGYDNPNMSGPTVATHRVRRSAFLRVTKTAAGLTILEL